MSSRKKRESGLLFVTFMVTVIVFIAMTALLVDFAMQAA